ncbi:unnamed protein product, partial [Polarella glacialis]
VAMFDRSPRSRRVAPGAAAAVAAVAVVATTTGAFHGASRRRSDPRPLRAGSGSLRRQSASAVTAAFLRVPGAGRLRSAGVRLERSPQVARLAIEVDLWAELAEE